MPSYSFLTDVEFIRDGAVRLAGGDKFEDFNFTLCEWTGAFGALFLQKGFHAGEVGRSPHLLKHFACRLYFLVCCVTITQFAARKCYEYPYLCRLIGCFDFAPHIPGLSQNGERTFAISFRKKYSSITSGGQGMQ